MNAFFTLFGVVCFFLFIGHCFGCALDAFDRWSTKRKVDAYLREYEEREKDEQATSHR